ncbi:hypothetical protein J4E83_004943 [Alternaria metachromatica]|uniref:uncharacterized protein n=1 Tax=Alternaria metachromatica TaxID=283354 RepID=UPI0020C45240|nr:uncharacterized protein J4E83_004943 [Alternaria metachromatica]KAI4622203.1 hypothetical protein J4E83_004943 [Alternaria metachromatica]
MSRNTGFRGKCTSAYKRLPQIFSDSPNLHIMLLLGSLEILLFAAARFLRHNYPETYAVCYWDKPGEMRTPSLGCPYNRDVFETPTHRGWLAFYALVVITLLHGLVAHRNKPWRLLQVTFWLHVLTTAIIRCLSTFSGWTTQPDWASLIWNSNSSGKFIWLWLLVEMGCWSWTCLGFYDDYYFREATRTVHDRSGHPVWTFTVDKSDEETTDALYSPYNLIFRPWRDIAVRLSYVHLIDNAIHVIWFRYFHVDAPYTAYVNNSEILTIILFVLLAVYTYTRMRTHVYFDNNTTEPLVDTESIVPFPIHSVSRDLCTFASPHNLFRTASRNHQVLLICTCLMFMLFPWSQNLDSRVAKFCGWLLMHSLIVLIVGQINDSWKEYNKAWKKGEEGDGQ